MIFLVVALLLVLLGLLLCALVLLTRINWQCAHILERVHRWRVRNE